MTVTVTVLVGVGRGQITVRVGEPRDSCRLFTGTVKGVVTVRVIPSPVLVERMGLEVVGMTVVIVTVTVVTGGGGHHHQGMEV